MDSKHVGAIVLLAMTTLMGSSCSKTHSAPNPQAQNPPSPQMGWVQSAHMATSLAQQFNLPILVFVSSDSCRYCRKMERDVWSNADIISIVETGFIPLKLNAEHDAGIVSALRIRSFPTTLLFSQDAKLIGGATGYMPPNQVAGLLRSGQWPQSASEEITLIQ